MVIISLYLSRSLLAQWFDPRHSTLEANKKLIQLSLTIDSLTYEVQRKEMFINTFKSIILEDFEGIDSTVTMTPQIARSSGNTNFDIISPVDSMLRKEFEEVGEEYLSLNTQYAQELQEVFFFTPIAGIVTEIFLPLFF